MIEVCSSHGTFWVDRKGVVVKMEASEELANIVKVDLEEVEAYYGVLEDSYDILDLRLIYLDGSIEEPEEFFRNYNG